MPYIEQARRDELDPLIERIADDLHAMGDVGGDLNYVITRLMTRRVEAVGLNYEGISSTIKEAERAASEFDRRILSEYEDVKAMLNGDVYGSLSDQLDDLWLDACWKELDKGSSVPASDQPFDQDVPESGVPQAS